MEAALIVFMLSMLAGVLGMFLNTHVGITSPPFFYAYGSIVHVIIILVVLR